MRLKSAIHDGNYLRSDLRYQRYVTVLSNIPLRYVGSEKKGRVLLFWLTFSSRLSSLLLREVKTANTAFVVLSLTCNSGGIHLQLPCLWLDRTGSGLKPIFRIRTGSDWEKLCCFNVIILTISKILVFIWFYRLLKWLCTFCHQQQKLYWGYFAIRTVPTFVHIKVEFVFLKARWTQSSG